MGHWIQWASEPTSSRCIHPLHLVPGRSPMYKRASFILLRKPQDVPKKNKVRFTPVQVEAIRSGMNPGLTMVVGPPGTGELTRR